ncbi:hypothetical protein N7532_008281 [Penicillium argentinense]|uniref:GPI mannosyltransferase 2 n=1 Tax=Penicillium argentinense TaxID=1131581 RepID=A0A9W9K2D0_9EURO|nr:uncharacterized protein N7532_008281 [Penicillium argentinense]KAJ5089597.1 hypothetical protein N7532_008281 [Penicillium argentinense]
MPSIGRVSASLLRVDNPGRSLTLAFWLWKALIFFVVVACPGPGYDTSTTLISDQQAGLAPDSQAVSLPFTFKFARWDAIYFLHTAENGYIFEQEWAFSYPRVLGFFLSGKFSMVAPMADCLAPISGDHITDRSSGIRRSGGQGGPVTAALIGVALSHVAHYLSVLALYGLSANVFGHATATQRLICFLSAALHIICPAGAFLSAPYGESIFSFLNISGFYLYTSSLIAEHNGAIRFRDILVLTAGVLFGLATLVRSNGILSGFLFAYDAAILSWTALTQGIPYRTIRRLVVIILGGSIVALGMIVPQIFAYRSYCMVETSARPWCNWPLPSIYSWVQGHYWNVGFLRYWTISNIPLFLLAAPVLAILVKSSWWALQAPSTLASGSGGHSSSPVSPGSMLFRLAVPQGLLAVMALTSYHVQIINRISSGYPLWYWWLVSTAMDSLHDPRKSYRILSVTGQAMLAAPLVPGCAACVMDRLPKLAEAYW